MDLLEFEERLGAPSVEPIEDPGTPRGGRHSLAAADSFVAVTPPPSNRRTTSTTPTSSSPDEAWTSLRSSPRAAINKACDGCARVFCISLSYFTLGMTVEWPYADGRGSVCKDCLKTQISILDSRGIKLPGLKKWISENLIVWAVCRVSYLSLRAEGFLRIDAEMMSKRINLLEWLSRLFAG